MLERRIAKLYAIGGGGRKESSAAAAATPSSKTTEGVIESVALKRTAVGRRRPARAATNEPKTIQNEISMSAPDRPREPAPYDESDGPARVQARSGLVGSFRLQI